MKKYTAYREAMNERKITSRNKSIIWSLRKYTRNETIYIKVSKVGNVHRVINRQPERKKYGEKKDRNTLKEKKSTV